MIISFTTIKHEFRKENNLSLTEYTLCDMVYFLSNNKSNPFPGWCSSPKNQIADEIGLSRQSVHNLIKKMIDEGFLIQEQTRGFLQTTQKWDQVYLSTKCKESLHVVKNQDVKKFDKNVKKLDTECKETLQPLLIIENKEEIRSKNGQPQKSGSLFPESDPDKLTLFRNSLVGKFEVFEKKFKEPEFQEIDLFYYFNAVSDWSDKANKKRTARGWLATARDFMRGDLEKGKLKKLNLQQETSGIDSDLMDYLKM